MPHYQSFLRMWMLHPAWRRERHSRPVLTHAAFALPPTCAANVVVPLQRQVELVRTVPPNIPINAWIPNGDKEFSSPAQHRQSSSTTAHFTNRVNASWSNLATGPTYNAPTDKEAQVAGFNPLFGTAYSQEVDGELDQSPCPSDIDHNNGTKMDASRNFEGQPVVNLSPNVADGDTDAPAAVTGDSTNTSMGGEETAHRVCVPNNPTTTWVEEELVIRNDTFIDAPAAATGKSKTTSASEIKSRSCVKGWTPGRFVVLAPCSEQWRISGREEGIDPWLSEGRWSGWSHLADNSNQWCMHASFVLLSGWYYQVALVVVFIIQLTLTERLENRSLMPCDVSTWKLKFHQHKNWWISRWAWGCWHLLLWWGCDQALEWSWWS